MKESAGAPTPTDAVTQTPTPAVSRLRRLAALGVSSTLLAGGLYIYDGEDWVQRASNFFGPHKTERQFQPVLGFVNNGLIGIEPSTFLPGLIGLKYKDPDTKEWKPYNVVVPTVTAYDREVNAEMMSPLVTMKQWTDEKTGDLNFELEYEKFQGIGDFDGIETFGNGAHFKVMGAIPEGKTEVKMWIEPLADSSPIQYATLGNFVGMTENITKVSASNGLYLDAQTFPEPQDGNFIGGDWYMYPLPQTGSVIMSSEDHQRVQWVTYTNALFAKMEIRRHSWRSEFGAGPRKDKFIEACLINQQINGPEKAIWTFGIYQDRNIIPEIDIPKGQLIYGS